ncbi:MAG: molybdate ABC transporter permease subunit [Planctomycetota bacterium]|nr:MAG: molybdate ABC transporter permease subunit [Planctomycetota bacterium]
MYNLTPLFLSYALALITSLLLLFLCLPLAYFLSFSSSRKTILLESLCTLPLLLPPTVLGFYLLLLFSPHNFLGGTLQKWGIHLAFSFPGLVIGSMIYSFPFMLQPLKQGFDAIPRRLVEVAMTLGKSPWTIFRKVLLPLLKGPLLKGLAMTFAHTLGEFGVVLMIGGSIEGRTKVASIAIYEEVQKMNYGAAHFYSLLLVLTGLIILGFLYYWTPKEEFKDKAHGFKKS